VFSLSLSILGCHSRAEDVAQEVFLKVWANARTYRIGANPKAWIMGITRNAAIDSLRKNKKEFSTDEIPEPHPEIHPTLEENVVVSITLTEALSELTNEEREIVILRVVAGLTASEVSKIMHTPLNTVYWKYNRAIETLKGIV